MKLCKNIKLSSWRKIVRNNNKYKIKELFKKIRNKDFSKLSFYGVNFKEANFDKASFERASFDWANFYKANFDKASFCETNFNKVNFKETNFHKASFEWTSFYKSSFNKASFYKSSFEFAKFLKTSFYETNFFMANFNKASFDNASFYDSVFYKTNFKFAKFKNAIINKTILPKDGNIEGYKKAENHVVKLKVNLNHGATGGFISRKCRCKKAKVLEIKSPDGNKVSKVASDYDSNFIYRINETIEVLNYDPRFYIECKAGIHFFLTQEEAENYLQN